MNNWLRTAFTAFTLLLSTPVLAAGMSTHALMADYARNYLSASHPLREILNAHRPALLAGAMYPDGGYASGALFEEDRHMAETAHWEFFVNPFMQYLYERDCASQALQNKLPAELGSADWAITTQAENLPLADLRVSNDCSHLIAFALGIAAHGMGDEVWDALFEPSVRQRGEESESSPAYIADTFPPGASPSVGDGLRQIIPAEGFDALAEAFGSASLNSIEYSMDVVAVREHALWQDIPLLVFPYPGVIVDIYKRYQSDFAVDELAVQRAALGTRLLISAERLGAAAEYDRVRQAMPFAADNYFTGSGGVQYTAQLIAGYYEHLWDKLSNGLDNARRPRVIGVHPQPGEMGLDPAPAPEDSRDASSPLADRYIYVSLSSSMDLDAVQQAGAFVLFDELGVPVPAEVSWLPGWANNGAHGFRLKLRNPQLKPNHRYTAVLTTLARDYRGGANPNSKLAQPMIWHFTTGDLPAAE